MNIELNTYLKGILLIILAFSAWRDLKEQRIPNEYIIRCICIRILFIISEVALNGADAIGNFLIKAGIGLIILGAGLLLRKVTKYGVGMGDIKIISLMYLYLDFNVWINAVCLSMILGLLYAVCVRIRLQKENRFPFAPALFLGTILSIIMIK